MRRWWGSATEEVPNMFGRRGVFFYSYPCPMGFFIRLILYFLGLVMGRCLWTGPGLGQAWPSGPAKPNLCPRSGPRSGPARPINCSEHEPRPGSSPSNFQRMGRGPARPVKFYFFPSRPGPTHGIRSEVHETRALYACGLVREFFSPVLKDAL